MVAVFDCETILDVELLKKGFKQAFMDHGINIAQCNDLELSKKAMEIQKEQSGSEFLPICYHQVVSIAAVLCDEY